MSNDSLLKIKLNHYGELIQIHRVESFRKRIILLMQSH